MDVEIPPQHEYRIEAQEGQRLRITVASGYAEVNGQELVSGRMYVFSGIRTALFSFTGARLHIEGTGGLCYVARHSMVPELFGFFERLGAGGAGVPRVLLLGRGRSTACATLSNYFVRTHRSVVVSEVDPATSNVFPGCLSTVVVDSLVDYAGGYRLTSPSCLFYGHSGITNAALYSQQVAAVAERSERVLAETSAAACHLIIAPNLEYERLKMLISLFGVTSVLVVGNERQYHELNGSLRSDKELVGSKRQGGSVNFTDSKNGSILYGNANARDGKRTETAPNNLQTAPNGSTKPNDPKQRPNQCPNTTFVENTGYVPTDRSCKSIARYFNGPENELTPSTLSLRQGEIVQIGEEFLAPESALPLGAERRVDSAGLSRVEPADHAVLAISEATEEQAVATTPVTGFLVCVDSKRLKVLCPQPKLPALTFLIQGSLRFTE